jgi:cytochrome c-type biogenesis protein CcmH/NrfG
VIVFGLHSAIDWTWFIPGTAIPALVCAGWLAGRGPIAAPIGRSGARRRLLDSPGVGAIALALVTLTLLYAWEIWQPLRSADDQAAAAAALQRGDANAAIADARTAAGVDPVDVASLWQLAAIYSGRGDNAGARRELQSATARQPQNPETWLQLGEFELQVHEPSRALGPLRRAAMLDQGSAEAAAALAQARQQAGASS